MCVGVCVCALLHPHTCACMRACVCMFLYVYMCVHIAGSHDCVLLTLRLHTGEVSSVDLWHPDVPEEPRFTVSIVDISHKQSSNGQFAIFLVPHGQ